MIKLKVGSLVLLLSASSCQSRAVFNDELGNEGIVEV